MEEHEKHTSTPTHRFIFAVNHPDLDISDIASEFMLEVLALAKRKGMNPLMSFYNPLMPESFDAEGVEDAVQNWQ